MCKITAATIAADGQAVAKALNSIATALQTSDPSLANELTVAAQTLVTATTGWTTGSPIAVINDAAQVAEAVLGAIPETAVYATFVAIAVTALDILIANVSTQATQTANIVGNKLAIEAHIDTLPENPYRGIVTIKPSLFGPRKALKDAWDKQVELEPNVGIKKL